jgi:hypothetical protein
MLFRLATLLCVGNILQAAAQSPALLAKEDYCTQAIKCYASSESERRLNERSLISFIHPNADCSNH